MQKVTKIPTLDAFTYIFKADSTHEGMRLDQFAQIHLGRTSREVIKRKIRLGEVSIARRKSPHRPSTRIHTGEEITMVICRDKSEGEYISEHWFNAPIAIDDTPEKLFENDDLIVVNKPPFMATHPTGKHFFNCVTVYFEATTKKTVHSLHRLDRETSGLLLLGKTPQSARTVTPFFEQGLVQKCYFLVAHKPKDSSPLSFPMSSNLRIGPSLEDERVKMDVFDPDKEEGKSALTHFEYLGETTDYLLLLAFPKTGRQHQIRVHAWAAGFPLMGDKIYGGELAVFKRYKDGISTSEDYEQLKFPRHALHAVALKFPDSFEVPGSDLPFFLCPLARDLAVWIDKNVDLTLDALWAMINKKVRGAFLI